MKHIGCIEMVSIPSLGINQAWAKIDTGAYSGAVHCTNVRVVRRGPDKTRVLKFEPLGKSALATETTVFYETYVRSATGHRVKRYVIDLEIVLNNRTYLTRIGIANRETMKRPVLLGRRFLREHRLLVDVQINQEYDDEGENTQ